MGFYIFQPKIELQQDANITNLHWMILKIIHLNFYAI